MASKKYLCFVSYLGLQNVKRPAQGSALPINHRFVQRTIKKSLAMRFGDKCRRIPEIEISTRHEKGVHAPGNSVTFVLEPYEEPLEPQRIMDSMNYSLLKRFNNLMFSSCHIVPEQFNVRDHAIAREYIYRVAIPKPGVDRSAGLEALLPIGELYRCGYLTNPENAHFDLNIATDLVEQLKGKHDFSSFCLPSEISKVRTIDEFEVNKLDMTTHVEFDENYKHIDIFEFYLRGKFFLYGQIPKMVSAITSSAIGLDSRHLVKELIEKPNLEWNPNVLLPTHGLYLIGVHYEDQDLKFGETRQVDKLDEDDFNHDLVAKTAYEEIDEVDESESSEKLDSI